MLIVWLKTDKINRFEKFNQSLKIKNVQAAYGELKLFSKDIFFVMVSFLFNLSNTTFSTTDLISLSFFDARSNFQQGNHQSAKISINTGLLVSFAIAKAVSKDTISLEYPIVKKKLINSGIIIFFIFIMINLTSICL